MTKNSKPETKTRVHLTDEQRLAKMEADLRAARQKIEAKAAKKSDAKRAVLAKLVERRDVLNTKIAALQAELGETEVVADVVEQAENAG